MASDLPQQFTKEIKRADTKLVRDKIDTRYVVDRLSYDACDKALKIVKSYGDNAVKWVYGPNWSCNNPMRPPSGFSFAVKRNSPVIPTPFHPQKIFYGTAALCLSDECKFKDGTKVTEESIIHNYQKLSRAINETIQQTTEYPIHEDNQQNWEACIGSGGAYAGIFSSEERGELHHKKQYWLVVQAGAQKASEDLYKRMEDVYYKRTNTINGDNTWEKFFFNNQHTTFLYNACKRVRGRLLAMLADALDIDIEKIRDSYGGYILEPTVETITNIVTVDPYDRDILVFHSNTVDPQIVSNGLLLNETPYLGPILFKGPSDKSKQFGSKWECDENSYGAFPVCTGRQKSIPDVISQLEKVDLLTSIPRDTIHFAYESPNPRNIRLASGLYRRRNAEFIAKEEELGYNHGWGSVNFRPLLVKIASTDEIPV